MLKLGLKKLKNKLSQFILGTSHFGGYINFENAKKIILKSYQYGIHKIDTSPMYGESKAESFIGIVKKQYNLKLKVFSKVGLEGFKKNNYFYARKIPLNSKNIISSVENSLKNLNIDCLDLLQLHCFDHKTPLEETIPAVLKLIKSGKVKDYGICNYNSYELEKLLKFLDKFEEKKPYSSQIHYNLIERKSEIDLIPLLKKNKIKVFANRVFAMGILSGKYIELKKYPKNSRASKSLRISNYINNQIINISKVLNSISEKKNTETINISIKWLINNKNINNSIIGINNLNHLKNFYNYNKSLKKINMNIVEQNLKIFKKSIMSNPKKYLIL